MDHTMRHAMANRRRNRQGGQNRPQHNKASVFDSNGPDVRIRGTAYQIVEKYLALAKDAASSGDRVLAENYFQHAEHYQRLINSWAEESGSGYGYANDTRAHQPSESEGQGNQELASRKENDVVVTRRMPTQGNVEDDLALPASILGGVPVSGPQTGEDPSRETRTVSVR